MTTTPNYPPPRFTPPPPDPPVAIQVVELDRPFVTAWKVGLGFWAAGVTVTILAAITYVIAFIIILGGLASLAS